MAIFTIDDLQKIDLRSLTCLADSGIDVSLRLSHQEREILKGVFNQISSDADASELSNFDLYLEARRAGVTPMFSSTAKTYILSDLLHLPDELLISLASDPFALLEMSDEERSEYLTARDSGIAHSDSEDRSASHSSISNMNLYLECRLNGYEIPRHANSNSGRSPYSLM